MSHCQAMRDQLLDAVRGRLAEPQRAAFHAHLETCAECRKIFERERALEGALERRPRFELPDGLRQKLAAQAANGGSESPKPPRRRSLGRWAAVALPSLAAALLAVVLVRGSGVSGQAIVDEAINDHLRILYAQHPIEVESGGVHQVKPWFAGKLDFAPALQFSGDEEFPLQGGAIALFVDRKAATFVFKHRLHTASLFVFRSQGLNFPWRSDQALGSVSGASAASRGFNVLLWRDKDLGYALVSDMDDKALARLAKKLTAP